MGKPVCDSVIFSGDMADFKDEALEKNSPANHDRNLAGFHPNKVSVTNDLTRR